MTKIKISPVATRTRSRKHDVIQKKKTQLISCKVKLVRLTNEQIMTATLKGLANIEKNSLDKPKYNLRNRQPKVEENPLTRKITNAVATVCSPTDMTVARLWNFLKKENSSPPLKNLCCLAKIASARGQH